MFAPVPRNNPLVLVTDQKISMAQQERDRHKKQSFLGEYIGDYSRV